MSWPAPAELTLPDTPAARAAAEIAERYCSPALRNHSIRAYVWGAAYALDRDLRVDAELLYVAALLHDLGLTGAFDNHRADFVDAGADVAWVFGAAAGWVPARRQRVGEIIVRHMWDSVDPAQDPEGHVLEVSTAIDISGRGVEEIPATLRADVLGRWPRLDLAGEFAACFRDQAARKPASSAGLAVAAGIETRITANPLECTDGSATRRRPT